MLPLTFSQGFNLGVSAYKEAHRIIYKKGLWKYFFLPGIIHGLLLIAVILLGWYLSGRITGWIYHLFGLDGSMEGFWRYVINIFYYTLKIAIQLTFICLYLYVHKIIVLTIVSPFLAVLSDKTEQAITGKKYPLTFYQFVHDYFRGIVVGLRITFMELFFVIATLLLSSIPIIGFLSPAIILSVSCYYFGFAMMDYTNERHRMSLRHSVRFISRYKGAAVGNGFVFYLILLIPVIGLLFAPTYATVAATITVLKIKESENPSGNIMCLNHDNKN